MSDDGAIVDASPPNNGPPPPAPSITKTDEEPAAPAVGAADDHDGVTPSLQRAHSNASSSSSLTRHRGSSGGNSSGSNGSGSGSINSSGVGGRMSSNSSMSCGGLRSLGARSTWSIEEESGDEEDDSEGSDYDDDGSVSCQGGRSRDTSSASLSMLFPPSRLTFHLPAHLEHLDGDGEDHHHDGPGRASMASRASTSKGGGRASGSASTLTGSHEASQQSEAADHHAHHPPHSPAGRGSRWTTLFTGRKSADTAASCRSPQSHGRRHHRVKIVSPALAHFRAKVQAAVRTAFAAGMAAATAQFVWAWSPNYTWFTITLCISGTRQSLGETLAAASDFWMGVCLLLPLLLLIRALRGHPAMVAVGLFLSVVAIIAYPGVSDAGKRMATILLALVVLAGERNPALAYHDVAADLLLTLFMSNVFSVAALLLPLPTAALALLDVRRQLKTLRHRLGALLRGFDHAFGLGEEVHHSMLEQLLEEAAQALTTIYGLLPFLRWEMALFCMPRRAHAHLVAYLAVVERQLALLRGLKLSLRRIPANNGTHREFLRFIHRPLGGLLLACVAVTDVAGKQIENELLIFPWLRSQRHQQQRQRGTTAYQAHSPRRPTTASPGRHHPDPRQQAATSANPGDDLDALATIAETRLDVLMAEYLKARLAVFFGFKVEVATPEETVGGGGFGLTVPASSRQAALQALLTPSEGEEEDGQDEHAQAAVAASTPSTSDPSTLDGSAASLRTTTGCVRMATGAGGEGNKFGAGLRKEAEVLMLTKRRMSGETVYSTFQQEFSRIGVHSVMPRNAFLMDVSLYVRSLDDLVAACSSSSTPSAASTRLSWLAKGKALVAPAVAWWRKRPWAHVRPAAADPSTSASGDGSDPRARATTAATAATTQSGQTHGSGGGSNATSAAVPSTGGSHQQQPPSRWPRNVLRRLRQPVKVALAVVVASLGILLRRGPATIWAVVAVCQSLTSHPGSSFRSSYNRIQGTVLGGMAGIAALEWLGLTSPPAIVAFITLWTLFCCFSRRSAIYGETAVVGALTAPIIMLGPISGEQGAMLRVEQTVLGCLIYSCIDNLVFPVRAKHDLRRELVDSLEAFRELWVCAFHVFLEQGGGKEEAARAQASYDRLTASFAQQEKYIALAADEPELWHKPFQATAYRKVVGTLTQASLFLSMLVRASAAFPSELSPKDRAMHAAIQGAVAELEHATCQALEQARDAVLGMKRRHAHHQPHAHPTRHHKGGGALPVVSDPGTTPGYHRRKKTTTAARPMSPTSVRAFALLRLAEQYARLKEFLDSFWAQHIETKRAHEDTQLVSVEFILSISSMLFAIDCLGQALLKVGHALRELVERERTNAYKL